MFSRGKVKAVKIKIISNNLEQRKEEKAIVLEY